MSVVGSTRTEPEADARQCAAGVEPCPASAANRTIQPHFMLVPSLACPAECAYCFGPHKGQIMSPETLEMSLDLISRIVRETGQRKVKVTFHGGEPLMAGHALWEQALNGLRSRFGPRGCEVALQSNLWLLDDTFCQLFQEHRVDIGTSLDGPEEITDGQRGHGYFARTMEGIRRAQAHGMTVGCIATFTPFSAPRWREVFDFFLAERLGMSIHACVPPLARPHSRYSLTSEQYADLLRQMLDYYVEHRREISVSSLDQMCQGVVCGQGKVCTFKDCLGMFLAIDPNGDIFPCQRFAGGADYRLGNLADEPSLGALLNSPVARRLADREQQVRKACAGCQHLDYCKGGCTYNAWASRENGRVRDPYCAAYRQTFDYVQRRVLDEMASDENVNAMAEQPFTGRGHPLLRKGPLIELAREGPHPSHMAATCKRIVAAVELARGPDVQSVAARLVAVGICRTQASAGASLAALQERLHPPTSPLNNLYLHVTFRCQLECTHCYARADATGRQQPDMPVEAVANLIREAKGLGFRQVVITGGEPLVHNERDDLLKTLAEARACSPPMNLVLRTNLAMPLTEEQLCRIAAAVGQVVVSVDGDQETHDERRGRGTYTAVVANLEAYCRIAAETRHAGELSLATVMRATEIQGEPGRAARELTRRLKVRRIRFRPLLPLGRAQDWDEPPTSEALGAYAEPMELIEDGFQPVSSCGLGQNLYVEPSGQSFPCYAYHRPHAYLGNVVSDGLESVLQSEDFTVLAHCGVDVNPKCRECDVRYLCGGACRAWGGEHTQRDLNAAPTECAGLKRRATRLLKAAGSYLGVAFGPGTED